MPEYGIIGDNFGTDLPETTIDRQDLAAERNAAKFSRTREFRELREYLEARIAFYQAYLPDGRPVTDVPSEERGNQWLASNLVISEFKAIIATYERASQTVTEADKR